MTGDNFRLVVYDDGSKSLFLGVTEVLHLDRNNINSCFIEPEYIGYRTMEKYKSGDMPDKKYYLPLPIERLRPMFYWKRRYSKAIFDDMRGRYVITGIDEKDGKIYAKGYYIYAKCLKGIRLFLRPINHKTLIKGR